MRYAENTGVSVERSKAEIEHLVEKYGATEFCSGWVDGRAVVGFKMRDRLLRFTLPLPSKQDERFKRTPKGRQRKDPTAWLREYEQACRQRWRSLALRIKSKLESVESGISEFDSEFLAEMVMPNGLTIGEQIVPRIAETLAGKRLPQLMYDGTQS